MTGVSLAMLLKVLQSIKSTEDQDKVSLLAGRGGRRGVGSNTYRQAARLAPVGLLL